MERPTPRRGLPARRLLALALLAAACRSAEAPPDAAGSSGGPSAALRASDEIAPASGTPERARGTDAGASPWLAAVDADRLADDVRWLADDRREGRRAGMPGERAAARWIAARLRPLGLEPAGDPDGESPWFQAFPVPLEPTDGGRSRVAVRGGGEGDVDASFADPDRVRPLFCSEGGSADGELAFAGYGITHEEQGWDDYADLAVEGKVVMIVRGTPPVPDVFAESGGASVEANPHADVAVSAKTKYWANSGSIFHKVMTARRHGAAGVLLAQHPDHAGEEPLRFHNGHTARAALPALTVAVEVAEALMPGYADLVAATDASARDALAPPAVGATGRGVALFADVARETGTAQNVLARLRGERPGRTVVIGAHFDHLGRGGTGSLAPGRYGEVHNGADDNASGTAAVLEMARLLAEGEAPEGDVVFALWSGEELGLLGSEYWAEHPTVPLEDVAANINLDMVGRAGAGVLQVLGAGTSPPFAGWLDEAGPAVGLELQVSLSGRGVGGSDHQTFLKREIPALHFFTGVHGDYHKPSDDVEGFEAPGASRVVALGVELARRVHAADALAFTVPEGDDPEDEERRQVSGFRSRLGSMPSYAWEGEGMKIDGTSPGSPAERAGLLAGDVLLQLGDVAIDDVYDLVYALGVYKPGDVVLVRYLRDGAEESVRLTLTGPQELE